MKPNYATAGNFNIDNVVTAEGRVFLRIMGGNSAYSAVAAHMWDPDVGIISSIPSNYPDRWLDSLSAAGINMTGAKKAVCAVTLDEWFFYQPDGSRLDQFFSKGDRYQNLPAQLTIEEMRSLREELESLSDNGVSFANFRKSHPINPKEISQEVMPSRSVHIAPNAYTVQSGLVDVFKQNNLLVSLDPPAYPTGIGKQELSALLDRVDVFCPSQKEVQAIFPGVELDKAIHQLIELGLKRLVVKLGSRGVLIWDSKEGKIRNVPAYPSQVVNLTGAGDAFCGGLLVGFWETGDLLAAAGYGIVSASLMIESGGILSALNIDRASAVKRLNTYRALVSGI